MEALWFHIAFAVPANLRQLRLGKGPAPLREQGMIKGKVRPSDGMTPLLLLPTASYPICKEPKNPLDDSCQGVS